MRGPAYPAPEPLAAFGSSACAVGLMPYAPLAPPSANTSETLPASWLRLSTLDRPWLRYQVTSEGLVDVVSVPTSGALPRLSPCISPFSNVRFSAAWGSGSVGGSLRTTIAESRPLYEPLEVENTIRRVRLSSGLPLMSAAPKRRANRVT